MYERQLDDFPIISLDDLNYDYKLDESLSNNPIYYIEMAYDLKQLMEQPTRETIETSTTLDTILVSHHDFQKKNGVMKYNFSDHYLVYTQLELNHNNVKKVSHNSVKFRDMTNFNPKSFIDDWIAVKCLMVLSVKTTFPGISGGIISPKYATRMPLSR